MKTLYLHIGTMKTGTSAIQRFCANNTEVLAQKGYCYPLLPYRYPNASHARNARFLIGKLYDENGEVDKEQMAERMAEGTQKIKDCFETYDNVIISDEGIWHGGARKKKQGPVLDFVREMQNSGIQVKIIAYLRCQEDYLESWWRQHVKKGYKCKQWDESIQALPKYFAADYEKQLAKFEYMVGQENMIVRRYEKGRFLGNEGTIFSDFLDAVGIEFTDEFELPLSTVNPSWTNNYVEIKRILNQMICEEGADKTEMTFFEEVGNHCCEFYPQNEKSDFFSPEERRAYAESFKESNRHVAERYLGEQDTDLFVYKEKKMPKWQPGTQQQYEDTIVFFGQALLECRRREDELQQEIERLKNRNIFRRCARKLYRVCKKIAKKLLRR